MATGKNKRLPPSERAQEFGDLAGRIDFAAIQKQEPNIQAQLLQQKEQELSQVQKAKKEQAAQLQQQLDQGGLTPEEEAEIKTEKELALAAGQKLSHEIKNIQEAKMEAVNKASEEYSYRNRTTPTPTR